MSKKTQNTIQTLLRNWLNGDVNAKPSLDQLTNNDPFLKDAIDGYQSNKGNHQNRLEILDKRLKNRVRAKKRSRVVFLIQRTAAVAAILLLVFGSFWWFNQGVYFNESVVAHQQDKLTPSETYDQIEVQKDVDIAENVEEISSIEDNRIENQPKKESLIASNVKKRIQTPLQTPSKKEAANQEPFDLAIQNTEKVDELKHEILELEKEEIEIVSTEMARSNVQVNTIEDTLSYADADIFDSTSIYFEEMANIDYTEEEEVAESSIASAVTEYSIASGQLDTINNLVKGFVLDAEGEPIFGATITEMNTENGVMTDFDGQFELKLVDFQNPIIVSYIGFEEVSHIPQQDSIHQFVLVPNAQLDAVSITGYSSRERDSVVQYLDTDISVYPKDGYEQFYKYLDEQLLYPQSAAAKQVEGIVKLRFEINENGIPQNVEVQESVGYGCDEEAIRLLKEGPNWKTKEGKTTTDLAIPFKLKEREQKAKTKKKNNGN